MARINKSELTKLEIINVATKQFLEKGYTNTTVSSIAKELEMSTGNLTFYYPTKEHLLSELVDMLCTFQRELMEEEADEGYSSVMAICLELTSMASACEEDEVIKDFFISTYTSPLCLDKIRKNDQKRAKEVFSTYCPDWTDEQYTVAEILVSGIEYATLTSSGEAISLEARITGALNQILAIYNVPKDLREQKIGRVRSMDCRMIGLRILSEFKNYVKESNEQALFDLLKLKQIAQ